jgi:hypothetical protein
MLIELSQLSIESLTKLADYFLAREDQDGGEFGPQSEHLADTIKSIGYVVVNARAHQLGVERPDPGE